MPSGLLNTSRSKIVIPTEPAAAGKWRDLLSSRRKQVPRLRESGRLRDGLTPLGMTNKKKRGFELHA